MRLQHDPDINTPVARLFQGANDIAIAQNIHFQPDRFFRGPNRICDRMYSRVRLNEDPDALHSRSRRTIALAGRAASSQPWQRDVASRHEETERYNEKRHERKRGWFVCKGMPCALHN